MRQVSSERRALNAAFESDAATIAFVDLAGFSAIADVHGDRAAVDMLDTFEALVQRALDGLPAPIKWIGDEVMLGFANPDTALRALGRLLPDCRNEPRIPLTRTGLHHGAIIRRRGDVFGSTVNIAARLAARAGPGQILATPIVADAAKASGIAVRDLGETQLRSVATPTALFSIELAPACDPAWIDPVCKMHAPYEAYLRTAPEGPWFCSQKCAAAFARRPEAYATQEPRPVAK